MSSKFNIIASRRQVLSLGASAFAAAGLAACSNSGQNNTTEVDGGGEGTASNSEATQLTIDPGKLTIATGNPAYEPWVVDDDPESGEGFEAAVAYALAKKMGFAEEDVVWVRTPFEEAFAPGDHDWDLNIQQVSISVDRQKAVDFSPAYYRPTQAVVVVKSSDYAKATSCADLANATIGVQVGSTAYEYVQNILKGGSTDGIEVYDDNAAAAAAVNSGQADAIVTDTPTAVYMSGEYAEDEQIQNGLVVGQIPGTEDEFGIGLTLAKDSELTPYVEEAMNALLEDGTIDDLISEWLAEYTTDIPTLTE